VAGAEPASAVTSPAEDSAIEDSAGAATLGEVVVTAQKRTERIQDVPMSLTAITGDQLASAQSFRLEDFLAKVPGLTMIDNGANGGQLIIRGLTTGSGGVNGTVATYVDETPYTSVGPWVGSASFTPNIDTFDMQRIEVLRGPQGTLYGSNALGGIVKYITNAPDPKAFAAKVSAGGSYVDDGAAGYDTHGMVNIPLGQVAALRVVGYDTYYPGFIDDPSRGLTDINGSHISGGRASLLISPSENFSIRVNALYQDRSARNPGEEDVNPKTLTPIYGSLIMERLVDENSYTKNELYNITVNGNLGFADLISSTSYARAPTSSLTDFSAEYGGFARLLLGAPYGVVDLSQPAEAFRAFTQELRLSSKQGSRLDWQLGAFYTDERGEDHERLIPVDISTGAVLFDFPSNLALSTLPVTYREYAEFVNMDYHLTSTLDASVGGRYSRGEQTFNEDNTGLFFGPKPIVFAQSTSQGVATYSGDVRWHATPNYMLYARVAKGFVPGGPNDVAPTAPAPSSYSSSTTINYEAGIKGDLMANRLALDVAAFMINWNDIQVTATINGLNQFVNGGAAKSKGAEWNLSYLPVSGLTLDLNGAYTDAYLTEATPASANGHAGDRLPAVPLWGLSATAEYVRPLFAGYSGLLAADWRFTGSRYSNFASIGSRQLLPSNKIVNFRAGVTAANWSVILYVKNAGNERAINYVNPYTLAGNAGPLAAVVYPPRTVGGEVTVSFP
jgi:outer membrane receptor protein involved in Fe transport